MKLRRVSIGVVSILTSLLLLLPATPALAASVTASPDHGSVDTLFHVSGSGFTAAASYTIFFPYNAPYEYETSGTVAVDGTISRSIDVPEMPGGSYTVRVETNFETASDTFNVEPDVNLNDSSVLVGDQVTLHGTGFRANRNVTVKFDSRTVGTATTNSRGSFSETFRIPEASRGSHDVTADDGVFDATDSLTVTQSMSISPTSGATGTTITVTGHGFRGKRSISIFFNGDRMDTSPSSVSTDSYGAFTADFDVPSCSNRSPQVLVSDGSYTASTTFTIVASLALSPTTGQVGDEIAMSGRGFRENRVIDITFDGDDLSTHPTTVRSDDTGCFDITFIVPPSSSGSHRIRANDGTESAEATFSTEAVIKLNPSSGPINATIQISGSGFGASRTVTIRFNGEHVRTGATDAQGNFADQFVVPPVSSGNYQVTASDGTTTESATFTVTTSLEINPTSGHVGTSITVTGTGFTGAVVIKYENATVATTTADSNGDFTISFSAPASIHGPHTVSASGAINTLNTTFIMESNPPPVPQPATPQNGSRQGSRPTFVWGAVSDPSGVTYTLQIAPDSSFVTLTLEKPGLTQAQYTLSSDEALRGTGSDAPYSWRVKAVDGAQNESGWSSTGSFYVQYLPQWALIVIIVVASVVIAILATRHYYRK